MLGLVFESTVVQMHCVRQMKIDVEMILLIHLKNNVMNEIQMDLVDVVQHVNSSHHHVLCQQIQAIQ